MSKKIITWNQLSPYFSKKEAWGEPDRINENLLIELYGLRHKLKSPIFITCGTQGEHSRNSEHYKGNAVDVIFKNLDRDFISQFLLIVQFGFTGIGYYPHWTYSGKKTGGWHLDIRQKRKGDKKATWLCIKNKEGKQIYLALSMENLRKYGVIK